MRLGGYEIASLLGAGGMGEVYRATDTVLKRQVALKVLPPDVANDPERVARFQREAEVLASLNHSNIAHLYGLEGLGGTLALVMELVEGPTLADRIAKGAVPLDEALPIAKQIAEALEAAHEQGIIHRDLKPANIKVKDDGTVKVLDFGLAKAMEPTSGIRSNPSAMTNSPTITSPALMTGVGVLLGTAAYMSPEQARGKPVDKRTDIWAFGCVLYEMLSGKRAFDDEDVSMALSKVLQRDPDFDLLPSIVPPRVSQVIRVCLRKDPKQRVADIRDVGLAFEGAFETDAPIAVAPAQTKPYGWMTAAAVFLLTTLALGATLYLRRSSGPEERLVRFSLSPPAESSRPILARFALSPDGQTIAFVARGADRVPRIYIQRMDAAEAQPLAGSDQGDSPFWSPDSRALGFSREGGLYRADLGSNPPRRLCDIPGTAIRGGTWNASGVIVFAAQAQAGGLFRVPDTGGTPVPVTTLDAAAEDAQHAGPWFLPDGRHLLFLTLAEGQTTGPIWAISLDDPSQRMRVVESAGSAAYAGGWLFYTMTAGARRLVAQPFDADHMALRGTPQPIRDGLPPANTAGYAGFAVSATGMLVVDRPRAVVHQLTWMDRTGHPVGTVGPRAEVIDFALTPDERIVAGLEIRDAGQRALWLFDGVHEHGTQLTYQERSIRPLWALDGRHVYFSLNSGQDVRLRSIVIGAAASSAFEHPGPFFSFEDMTRDGRYVVFKGLDRRIWIQAVSGEEPRSLVESPYWADYPRVSPDGRWLAYALNLPSGREIFVQPFDRAGDRTDIGKGFGPIWRDDGRELYYESADGVLMFVAIAERGNTMESGVPQPLFVVRTQGIAPSQPHNVEVAAHGQKFLVNAIVAESDNQPLEVTTNWTADLKK
jgi:Tol biopolymer transport system component